MSLNIKNDETYRLVEELAKLTGETLTGAVTQAVRERLERLHRQRKAAGVHIEPVTEIQARLARDAYRDFGKGSGHSARLNFGDCFAYALAKTTGEPLLFIGADFGHTDIMSAIA